MDFVVVRTHVINHARFLEAGAPARDLWHWGMLYAGQHETDGHLPMVAVLASPWGHGSKRNVMLADKLVAVGLWERTDLGFRILRWTEMGNKTKAEIERSRSLWRAKSAAKAEAKRKREAALTESFAVSPPESPQGNPPRFLNCNSYSSSADQKNLAEGESARGGPPEWFAVDMVGMLEMNAPDVFRALGNIGERWLQYQAAIERGRGQTAGAAAGYMTTMIRAELARASRGGASTKQPLGKVDPNSWITDTDFAKKAGT